MWSDRLDFVETCYFYQLWEFSLMAIINNNNNNLLLNNSISKLLGRTHSITYFNWLEFDPRLLKILTFLEWVRLKRDSTYLNPILLGQKMTFSNLQQLFVSLRSQKSTPGMGNETRIPWDLCPGTWDRDWYSWDAWDSDNYRLDSLGTKISWSAEFPAFFDPFSEGVKIIF